MKELKDLWIRLMSGLKDFPWPTFLAITLIWCTIGWIFVVVLFKENRQLIKDGKAASDLTIEAQGKLLKYQEAELSDAKKDKKELEVYRLHDTTIHR